MNENAGMTPVRKWPTVRIDPEVLAAVRASAAAANITYIAYVNDVLKAALTVTGTDTD